MKIRRKRRTVPACSGDGMFEEKINIDRMDQAATLFGSLDGNIRLVEQQYHVEIVCRGSELKISGEPEDVEKATRAVKSLIALINRGETVSEQNVRYCFELVKDGSERKLEALAGDCICLTSKGKPVKAKTLGQRRYCTAIESNTVTIGVGPAGTGKTYLALTASATAR